jgi:hypothetical protein
MLTSLNEDISAVHQREPDEHISEQDRSSCMLISASTASRAAPVENASAGHLLSPGRRDEAT